MPRGSAKVCDNLEYDIANGVGQGRVVEDELNYVNNAAASGLDVRARDETRTVASDNE